ncbi:hypothetical protein SAMN05421503_1499 [Terribacillus aidingensis]|uniref:Uncharacterized protein n=1 Tax=Terribacillus aidingensis TaxID=586416 RepID=A0A285NKJ4_9BACI|nr:hypothetical protein [Terribacillus aidingensis]SNZ10044.1 hypothetical protein SAMN05421503_1499 [Terribacillus aidingensis]
MKYIKFFISVVLGVVLAGCSSSERMIISEKTIQNVSVSKSEGYGGLNEAFLWTAGSLTEMKLFEEMINSARKEEVKTGKPAYDVLLDYGEGESGGERVIHITESDDGRWLLTYDGHQDKTYAATKESSQPVQDLIESVD